MTLVADIFITIKPTKERIAITAKSLKSFFENTDSNLYRLTLCFDGKLDEELSFIFANELASLNVNLLDKVNYTLQSSENEGLGPTINRAVSHIKSINDWYSHATHGDPSKVSSLIVMLQDDIQYSKGWLKTLANMFMTNEHLYNLGFASGIECIEHKVKKVIVPDKIILKDWIRATCMMARREYWESMMPIPRFDPETGRIRAKPNDGMGSGVDWWLIRNHENSVSKTGKTCLVMPGLLQHIGYNKSTWLNREMPESDLDKEKMK